MPDDLTGNGDHRAILAEVRANRDQIKAFGLKIDRLADAVSRMTGETRGKDLLYALYKERLDRVEVVVGKQGLVASIAGAIAGAVVLAIQWAVNK